MTRVASARSGARCRSGEAVRYEGQQPTIRAVRERLGDTGSPNTIHKHLAAWREARPV
ncbi:TPA: DNA-binding protein, partial [Salmonella enterica]